MDKSSNYYLDARRVWNEVIGDAVSRARIMTIFASAMLVINLCALAAIVYLANRSQFVPYVMVLNKNMTPISMGIASPQTAQSKAVMRSFIARFIADLRTITADATVLKKQYKQLYSMLSPSTQAFTVISDNFSENDPFERAATEVVSVEVNSVLLQSPGTWEVEWTEKVQGRRGEKRGSHVYRAYLHTKISTTDNPVIVMHNPLGIMVEAFEFAEKLV